MKDNFKILELYRKMIGFCFAVFEQFLTLFLFLFCLIFYIGLFLFFYGDFPFLEFFGIIIKLMNLAVEAKWLFLSLLIYTIPLMLFVSLITFLLILLINENNILLIKLISLNSSIFIFFISLIMFFFYDINNINYQFVFEFNAVSLFNIFGDLFDLKYGIDGLSILFLLLTNFIVVICIISDWSNLEYNIKGKFFFILLLHFILINFFCTLSLFIFYISFEAVLIPMFLLVGFWGSRYRKIHAAKQLFFYTMCSSILLFLGIAYIFVSTGTCNFNSIINNHEVYFTKEVEIILWLAFFLPFAVKVPMIPLHIWLPEAHVEAPTSGSILLAAILLKLGLYGILRFIMPAFPYATTFFTPLVLLFAVISIIYGSLTTIRQIDLKKIIAYSSVVHMNFALIGLFSMTAQGISGSIYLMLSHGIVSGALFLCVGILYDRYHTRLIKYYGGLVQYMPLYSFYFLFFTMANIGLPGTSSFVGEFLIMLGAFDYNIVICFFASTSVILSACYGIWLYNRVVYGSVNNNYIKKFSDINKREFTLLFLLGFITLLGGFFPWVFTDVYELYVYKLLNYINGI